MAQSSTEPQRSGTRTPTRSSRRSHPNLQHLSLAPLSSNFDSDAPSTETRSRSPHSSYIQPKTAPTTPGILSRSPSRHRNNGHVHYVHDSYFITHVSTDNGINKSKSDAELHGDLATGYPRHHARKHTAPGSINLSHTGRKATTPRHHTREGSSDWLYRAGLAITSESREAKGQSWLSRRESSTSLVKQDASDSDDNTAAGSGHPSRSHSTFFADDEYSPATPKSRAGSRAGSAFNSRRGSRVGSRAELRGLTGITPKDHRTPAHVADGEDGYFGEHRASDIPLEPDFVESDEEGVGDEEEVARLAAERGFGLGGWMDRLIGWTLFSVEEDGEETDEEEQTTEHEEQTDEAKKRREYEAKRRREERARIQAASSAAKERKEQLPEPSQGEGEGGWQDAAWLLSVASKVLL